MKLGEHLRVRPEMELLLCCARTTLSPQHAARIHEIASGPLDWEWLLPAADEHALIPLLHWHLHAVGGDAVPAAWRGMLDELFRENARRNLLSTSRLLEIMDSAARAGVAPIPYKGPVLAATAYGNLSLRRFVDLDVLVRDADMPRAEQSLVSLGYQPETPYSSNGTRAGWPGQYCFQRAEHPPQLVEVHTERTLRYAPRPFNFERIWARAQTTNVGGRTLRTLAPEDQFTLLCVHGTKHMWERLAWIADIAELVRKHRDEGWNAIITTAQQAGAERMVRLGLGLAGDLLDAPLPDAAREWLAVDSATLRAAEQISRRIFGEGPPRGVLQRFRFRARMAPGALGGLSYAARLTLSPTEEDWNQGNGFSQRARRVLRLARKYGLGGGQPQRDLGGFEPTPPEVAERMLALAGVQAGDVLYDLGCGDGQIVVTAAKQFGIRAVGVDVDPQRLIEARAKAAQAGVAAQVEFVQCDAKKVSLTAATVVTLYLPWASNLRLRRRLRETLRPGARIVSRGAGMGDWTPERSEEVQDARGKSNPLHLWVIR